MIKVALEGLANILKVGETDKARKHGPNIFAKKVEECGGLDLLEGLIMQTVDVVGDEIYDRVIMIRRKFFFREQDIAYVNPMEVDSMTNTFKFGEETEVTVKGMAGTTVGFNF